MLLCQWGLGEAEFRGARTARDMMNKNIAKNEHQDDGFLGSFALLLCVCFVLSKQYILYLDSL